jgi:hypothetical protein
MHDRPVTWTGRGLRLAYVGDIVLAVTAAIYFLSYSGKLAGFGFVVAGAVGLLSIQRMWIGRNEFGPDHSRNVKRGLALFFVGGFLFIYAFLAGLTNVPATLDFRNMYPPVLALGLAIAAETASGALLLFGLVGSARKPFAIGYAVLGAVAGITVLVLGMRLVSEYEGAQIYNAEIAQARLDMFLGSFLPIAMAMFLLTRLWVLFLLRASRREVQEAEHEGMAATDSSPANAADPAPQP